jgi:translation elongation factor EF-Tu-like GTPase
MMSEEMIQFTVEDTFLIEGRGLVVTGKMVGERHGFRSGARVKVRRPDGTQITGAVRGVDVFGSCFTEGAGIGVLLDVSVGKEAVPRGSVVSLEAV